MEDDTYHNVCKVLRYILNISDLFNKIIFNSKKNKQQHSKHPRVKPRNVYHY